MTVQSVVEIFTFNLMKGSNFRARGDGAIDLKASLIQTQISLLQSV